MGDLEANRVRALRYCIGWANVVDAGDRSQLEAVRAEIGEDFEPLADTLAGLVLVMMAERFGGATVAGLRHMIANITLTTD